MICPFCALKCKTLLISDIFQSPEEFPKGRSFRHRKPSSKYKKEGARTFPDKCWACQFPQCAVDRPEHSTAAGIILALLPLSQGCHPLVSFLHVCL